MGKIDNYLQEIIKISDKYLHQVFNQSNYDQFIKKISYLGVLTDRKEIVKKFSQEYINFVKKVFQKQYKNTDKKLMSFIQNDKKK